MTEQTTPIYELSFNLLVEWQAHALSNAGSNGSNRLLPRRQFLADGTETGACSGNILKHHHAMLAADYFAAEGCPLCPACQTRDSRRAAALLNHPSYQALSLTQILNDCALCDTHGFLVTAKNAHDENEVTRARLNKETVMNFGYALALPNFSKETEQLHTRSGASKEEGQMLMKIPARSGVYALTIRYTCAGIGADTRQWQLLVTDPTCRLKRHRALLSALRDLLVSPSGAKMGTMLPHFTGLRGAIVERTSIGRAPSLSALDEAFISKLSMMEDPTYHVVPFDNVGTFYQLMNQLIATTSPALHSSWKNTNETA